MEELDVAIKAAEESSKILLKYFRKNLKVDTKSDKTPVTIADKESETKIVSIIKKYFPDHNFLGEEFSYKKTDSEYKWIMKIHEEDERLSKEVLHTSLDDAFLEI